MLTNASPTNIRSFHSRERNSPRKAKSSARYSGMHQPLNLTENCQIDSNKTVTVNQNQPRMSWHGAKEHSTLIRIDWPIENSVNSLTASTLNSSPLTPITPIYDPLESDSEASEHNKRTIKISEENCDNCEEEKCLKCELKECDDYGPVKVAFKIGLPVKEFLAASNDERKSLHDSLESPSTNISYQNLNRLSAISTNSSNSDPNSGRKHDVPYENIMADDKRTSIMTSSHESSSSYSNISPLKHGDELYECYSFSRPNYINLQSSSTSKSSSTSPLKSPLRSTISITFKSPTKSTKNDYENLVTPTNIIDRDSVYEDVDLAKNLSIVEDATVPGTDASLPTQQACQPDSYTEDLIILETPTEEKDDRNNQFDIYNQVKFYKKSVEEVNALLEPDNDDKEENNPYENIDFTELRAVEEFDHRLKEDLNCDTIVNAIENHNDIIEDIKQRTDSERENGNIVKPLKKNLNVKQLATKFESPTEIKGPFNFEKFKVSTLDRTTAESNKIPKKDLTIKIPPPISPKTYKLSKHSVNARSLDENAFVKEFGCQNDRHGRRRSLEVKETRKHTKFLPDLNLNLDEDVKIIEDITPTTENKISLIQRFDDKPKSELKTLIGFDTEKKLSRERIEKYKEERRTFLREKYSSQSFRSSNPIEHLTRIKIKKEELPKKEACERLTDDHPKFERRNTVDLGQRMRFSLAKSANNIDTIKSTVDIDEFSNVDVNRDVPESSRAKTSGQFEK